MSKQNSTIAYYKKNSQQLAEQYNSVTFENITLLYAEFVYTIR